MRRQRHKHLPPLTRSPYPHPTSSMRLKCGYARPPDKHFELGLGFTLHILTPKSSHGRVTLNFLLAFMRTTASVRDGLHHHQDLHTCLASYRIGLEKTACGIAIQTKVVILGYLPEPCFPRSFMRQRVPIAPHDETV